MTHEGDPAWPRGLPRGSLHQALKTQAQQGLAYKASVDVGIEAVWLNEALRAGPSKGGIDLIFSPEKSQLSYLSKAAHALLR